VGKLKEWDGSDQEFWQAVAIGGRNLSGFRAKAILEEILRLARERVLEAEKPKILV
jgi:hypothetical protein